MRYILIAHAIFITQPYAMSFQVLCVTEEPSEEVSESFEFVNAQAMRNFVTNTLICFYPSCLQLCQDRIKCREVSVSKAFKSFFLSKYFLQKNAIKYKF